MLRFSASIIYDEHTVCLLDSTTISTFNFSHRIVFLALCITLIIGGVVLGLDNASGIICLLLGSFMIPSVNNTKSKNARAVLKAIQGKQLRMEYCFSDSSFECKAGDSITTNRYESIIRLVENGDYYYLYQTKSQACMIKKSSIEPFELENFKLFLKESVGLEWTQPTNIKNFSLGKIRSDRKNTRMK